MEEKILSAEELLKCHQDRQNFNLPNYGEKSIRPNGSWQESHDLQHRLDTLKSTLEAPRVSQRSQLSEAIWKSTIAEAQVVRPSGKHWDVLGHIRDDQLHLHPEEALFLLESNNIEIKSNDIAMSIQQAFEVMLGKNCSLSEYRTYSHLVRQGYKVVRHQGDLGITYYEKKIRLDHYRTKHKRKHNKNDQEVIHEGDAKSPRIEEITIVENDVVEVNDKESNDIEEITIVSNENSDSEVINDDTDEKDDEIEILNEAELNRIKALNMFPNIYQESEVTLKTPSTDLLPFRVWPKHKTYKLKIKQESDSKVAVVANNDVKETLQVTIDLIDDGDREVNLISPKNGSKKKPRRVFYNQYKYYNKVSKGKSFQGQKVKNSRKASTKWRYFRQKIAQEENEALMPEIITLSDDENSSSSVPKISKILLEGPLKSLWNGHNTPMLRPYQAKSTKAIFSKLTLRHISNDAEGCESKVFKISYDVYGPNVHLKKSAPRLPNFRLVICQSDETLPSEDDLKATMGDIKDKVPLMFAIVSQSDIAFFSLYPTNLPTEITMG